MAATAGQEIVDRRDKEVKAENASLGVVLDAVASEAADSGLDWIQEYLNTSLRRENEVLTKRYSPGYGDLELSAQKTVFDALELDKIGLVITNNFILVPEKSVIGIAGVVDG